MEETQEPEEGQSDSDDKKCCGFRVRNKFLIPNLAAVPLGIAVGVIAKSYAPVSARNKIFIGFPGEMFTRMLQMLTVPVIVTGLMTGVSGLRNPTTRKIAKRVAVYCALTTLISTTLGLTLMLLVQPGVVIDDENEADDDDEKKFVSVPVVLDLVRNLFPHNLIQACFQQHKTERVELEIHTDDPNVNATEVRVNGIYVEGVNTLGLIIYGFVFGVTVTMLGETGDIIVNISVTIHRITKYVISLILYFQPFGLVFMTASYVFEAEDMDCIYGVGKFVAVVVVGLIIHAAIVLPGIYLLTVRRNPWTVIKGVSPALQTALLSSSSAATLPHTLTCCVERNGVDHRISRFMLSIGADFNKDGTLLYEVMAAVFISQLNNVNLDLSQIIAIGLTGVVSSIKPAGIPTTGSMTTLFVLTAVGLPAREVCILVIVEWLLDHCNTVVNVLVDCIGVSLVYHLSREEVAEMGGQDEDSLRTVVSNVDGLPSSTGTFTTI